MRTIITIDIMMDTLADLDIAERRSSHGVRHEAWAACRKDLETPAAAMNRFCTPPQNSSAAAAQ